MFQCNAQHIGYNEKDWLAPPLIYSWSQQLCDGPLYQVTIVGGRVMAAAWKVGYYGIQAEIWCLESASGSVLWYGFFPEVSGMSPCSYANSLVYVQLVGDPSPDLLWALDLETGEAVWASEYRVQGIEALAPTVYQGRAFICGNYYGGAHTFDGITGEFLWKCGGAMKYEWTPAVYQDVVYMYFGGYLFFRDVSTGEMLWSYRPEDDTVTGGKHFGDQGNAPVLDTTTGILYLTQDAAIYAVDIKTREMIWSRRNSYYRVTPALYDGKLLARYRPFCVQVLDALTGEELWRFDGNCRFTVDYPPVVSNEHFYISSSERVYAVNMATQKSDWSYPISGFVTVGNGQLYVSTHEGKLYAFKNFYLAANDDADSELPQDFELHQNYPNPFNPVTQIEYSLPIRSHVKLVVHNLLGQTVRTLVNEPRQAGTHTATWNGTDEHGHPVSSGVYLYRLKADNFTTSKKMLLLK
ncbi:MAG: PQQ-binding-like beta-propeller repeat protein [bacterium]